MSTNSTYRLEAVGPVTFARFQSYRVGDQPPTQLYQLTEGDEVPRVVIDLQEVGLLTSNAIGVFVTLNRKIILKGGKLAFCGLDDNLRSLFKITMLERIFNLCHSEEAAIQAVS